MTALFVFALPFALYGIAYGFYYLGRALLEWLLSRKEKGR